MRSPVCQPHICKHFRIIAAIIIMILRNYLRIIIDKPCKIWLNVYESYH